MSFQPVCVNVRWVTGCPGTLGDHHDTRGCQLQSVPVKLLLSRLCYYVIVGSCQYIYEPKRLTTEDTLHWSCVEVLCSFPYLCHFNYHFLLPLHHHLYLHHSSLFLVHLCLRLFLLFLCHPYLLLIQVQGLQALIWSMIVSPDYLHSPGSFSH